MYSYNLDFVTILFVHIKSHMICINITCFGRFIEADNNIVTKSLHKNTLEPQL